LLKFQIFVGGGQVERMGKKPSKRACILDCDKKTPSPRVDDEGTICLKPWMMALRGISTLGADR